MRVFFVIIYLGDYSMEIFSRDFDSLKNELELLKECLLKTKPKDIIDVIEMIEGFYLVLYELSGEEDIEAIDILQKNEKYRNYKNNERQLLHRKNIQNFIQEKERHSSFSGKVLNLYDDRRLIDYRPRILNLRENEMFEIISDFLNNEFNQADNFKKIIEEKKIFKSIIPPEEDCTIGSSGYTMFNYITNNSFIVLNDDKYIKDVNMMRIIVHEFGHYMDNISRANVSRKENTGYYWLSSYAEVYSMLYEKLFFDYLIKNNIYKENAFTGLKRFFVEIYENFNSVEYLSSLDDKLLKNERYKQEKNLADQVKMSEDGLLYISRAILDNFNETKLYSYGGIIANYFASLKHSDVEEFDRQFSKFKQRRFGLFDFNIFETIGTTEDEIIEIYSKCLDRVTGKKLILE